MEEQIERVLLQGLMHLRCLIWPRIGNAMHASLHSHAPQLSILGAGDSGPALDEPYALHIAQYDWAAAAKRRDACHPCSGTGVDGAQQQQGDMPTGSSTAVIPLADRFRCI